MRHSRHLSRYLLTASLCVLGVSATAQTPSATTFPPDAAPVTADALRQRLVGQSFTAKMSNGNQMRLQFREDFVYVNSGPTNDSGRWRTDGGQLCIDWNRIPGSGCSQARMVGNVVYITRVSNGEVMRLDDQ